MSVIIWRGLKHGQLQHALLDAPFVQGHTRVNGEQARNSFLSPAPVRAMDTYETAEFDEDRMTTESKIFTTALFERFPEFRRHASMVRAHGAEKWSLVVTVPAPTGDPKAGLTVWVDVGKEPSVEFGNWHTHESLWSDASENAPLHTEILDLIEGIMQDRYVLFEDVGGPSDGDATIIDLSSEDALLDKVTSNYSPRRARLRSWSGRLDRTIDLANLDQEL
jgi:hypothetical protein